MTTSKRSQAPQAPPSSPVAAYVRREMLLLGKERRYGDPLTSEEIAAIPELGLRAMVEDRSIDLAGDLERTEPGREIAQLQREVTELRRRIEALEALPHPKVVKHYKEA